jgi:hypothetical protein
LTVAEKCRQLGRVLAAAPAASAARAVAARFGMVVPDGMLNNAGERSLCPLFRRWLLTNTRLDMVVSLPDFAFRKSGAQNKTSLLFFTKLTDEERKELADALEKARVQAALDLREDLPDHEIETEALRRVYAAGSKADYRSLLQRPSTSATRLLGSTTPGTTSTS